MKPSVDAQVQHGERVRRAHAAARWRAALFDSLLAWYILGGTMWFLRWWTHPPAVSGGAPEAFSPTLHLGLLVGGLLVGLLWSSIRTSPGRMAVAQTTPLLRGDAPKPAGGFWRTWHGRAVLYALALTLGLGLRITQVDPYALFSSEGLAGAGRIFRALVQPNLAIAGVVFDKMVETIFVALMATVAAVPVAFVLSFAAARNLSRHSAGAMALYSLVRFLANLTRSIEPVLWAIIFSVWVSFGPFGGMLALFVHSVASLIKLYSEQIESVDTGPIEAIEATGAGRLQTIWYAVVPQVVLPYLSYTIYRWDINVRMATIIGLVGGGGVGELLMQYFGLGRYNEVGTIVLFITAVVWTMDWLSAKVREAIA